MYRELFDEGQASVEHVCSEEELLLDGGISQISSAEVLVYFTDRNIKVQLIAHMDQESAKDQHCMVEQESKFGGQLDVHASELDPPSDGRLHAWWRFQPNVIPVRALDGFKELGIFEIDLLLESTSEDTQVVSHEKIGVVVQQLLIKFDPQFPTLDFEILSGPLVQSLFGVVVQGKTFLII